MGEWRRTDRFDAQACALYDRHYSRQTQGSGQCSRPCADVVLVTPDARAGWVSIRPRFAMHKWPGAWECMWFRNEAPDLYLSSDLISEAVALTRAEWGDPPQLGMITFVDEDAVRRKRDPGRCFRRVGFVPVGYTTERHRLVLRLPAASFPEAPWQQGTLETA